MKKNVLIVNNTLGEGGAEKVLVDVLNKFDYEKYNVKLLILDNKGVHFNKLNENVKLKYIYPNIQPKSKLGIKLWNCFKYRTMNHLYYFIYKLYAGMNNDVEIAFLEGEPTRFISKSLNKKSKKIAWVHTDLEMCRPKEINELDQLVYSKFDDIICVSNSSKEVFDKLYSDLNKDAKVIYNIIDKNNINKLANESIKFKSNKPIIISVGRLTEMKRFDLIIKAHKEVINRGIDHELLILGVGPCKDSLVELAKNLNVSDSVKFLGYVQNPYPYIKYADIFISASDFEGFSLVIAESIVLCKAIISTNNGGGTELLENGKYGQIINKDDLNSLSDGIYNILNNKKLKEDLEKKSAERSKIFNSDLVMDSIYKIIDM